MIKRNFYVKADKNDDYKILEFSSDPITLLSENEECFYLLENSPIFSNVSFINGFNGITYQDIPCYKIDQDSIQETGTKFRNAMIIEVDENDFIVPLKEKRKNKMKEPLYDRLSKYDWKITRHKTQVDAGLTKKLSDQEYIDLCVEMDGIRTTSDNKEAEIDALTTAQEILDYDITIE